MSRQWKPGRRLLEIGLLRTLVRACRSKIGLKTEEDITAPPPHYHQATTICDSPNPPSTTTVHGSGAGSACCQPARHIPISITVYLGKTSLRVADYDKAAGCSGRPCSCDLWDQSIGRFPCLFVYFTPELRYVETGPTEVTCCLTGVWVTSPIQPSLTQY